jgi:beta-lactamase regulating signal transducer with metallopeptidase domain
MKLLFFSHNLNYALGWTVVHSLWQALIIAILTGIALIILQKKSSKFRYILANIGLWAVLFAAITTFFMYYDFSKNASELVFIPENKTSILQLISQPQIDDIPTSFSHEANTGFSIAEMKNYFNQNMYFIVSLWFMGFSVFLLKILGSISYIYYLKNRLNFPAEEYWQDLLNTMRKRTNVTKYIDLVESALVRSPVVIGHLKPMILFPIGAINRLNIKEVEAILAHELAHVMRHDYFFNILQSVIEALFYFHPAVWWLSSQIRTERENCCDDIAISLCGNAVTYAKSLVSVQEMAYFAPQMAMAFAGTDRKKHLLMRVQRVLNQPKSKVNIMEKIAAICILLVVMTGFAFSNNQFSNNATNEDNKTKISKNADNQQNTNVFYLKYKQNDELDSIPLEKQIADGNYNFVNNLYDVNLTVKNQNVIQFKINGLEVDKKDMPKFEKMIKGLISAKDEQNEEEISTEITRNYSYHSDNEDNSTINIDEHNLKMVSSDGVISEMPLNDKGEGRRLTIKKQEQAPILVSLEDKTNAIYIDGVKSNATALKKLGWKVKGNGLQPLSGLAPLPPPAPNNFAIPRPPNPPSPSHVDSEEDEVKADARKKEHEAFDKWLTNELIKDGYLKNKNNYSFSWDNKSMTVDGKKVSDDNRKKYAAMYKKITGEDQGKAFSMTKSYNSSEN